MLAPGTNGHDLIEAGGTEESVLRTGVCEEGIGRLDVGPLSALLGLDVVVDALDQFRGQLA